jgi:predicted nucleotidyltransferase component of viral defense system
MAERFLALGNEDRREALLIAADKTGRPSYLLEKDIWVAWTLGVLFETPLGKHLLFKRGTPPSKS